MAQWKSFEDLSRVMWGTNAVEGADYPGHERLMIGYLARIAKALESLDRKIVCDNVLRLAQQIDRRREQTAKRRRVKKRKEATDAKR